MLHYHNAGSSPGEGSDETNSGEVKAAIQFTQVGRRISFKERKLDSSACGQIGLALLYHLNRNGVLQRCNHNSICSLRSTYRACSRSRLTIVQSVGGLLHQDQANQLIGLRCCLGNRQMDTVRASGGEQRHCVRLCRADERLALNRQQLVARRQPAVAMGSTIRYHGFDVNAVLLLRALGLHV
ncbi:unnamed protein product [Protopolystoma xenopodis]|uniref:Uncharacterized protein n=1 Tax=Protopolystoma xenopodis TaxID=117903 RepID=A0A448XE93_9PLAT|nr:unnamed protein product [Protopolystoma xenopodis]